MGHVLLHPQLCLHAFVAVVHSGTVSFSHAGGQLCAAVAEALYGDGLSAIHGLILGHSLTVLCGSDILAAVTARIRHGSRFVWLEILLDSHDFGGLHRCGVRSAELDGSPVEFNVRFTA